MDDPLDITSNKPSKLMSALSVRELTSRELTSRELTEKLNELIILTNAAQTDRHQVNNRLHMLLSGVSERIAVADRTAQIAADAAKRLAIMQDQLRVQVGALEKQMTELDHIMRGVDGNDGMRADLAAIRKEQLDAAGRQRYLELRIAVVVSVLVGAGFGALKLIGV